MADASLPHVKRAKFFRNGDSYFKGKVMVVNPRYYRNFDSFLDTVTWSVHSTNAVTRICTPQGRHYVHNVESFQNGGNYVAVGRERFKPLNYGEEKAKNATIRLPPIWRSQRASSGRYRKVYEGEKQALKRIHVFKNGDNITPARMILLKKKVLTDMELVFAALQESGINFDFAISKLFTLNGQQIYSCEQLEHDGRYVALQRGSRFKPINYDGNTNFSPRNASTNFTRLPPIASRVNPAKISYSPRKNPEPPSQVKLGPPKQHQPKRSDKKREEKRKKQPIPPQDSIVSPFEDQNLQRESFSHVSLSVTPPPLDESPDFTMSENKAKEHEDLANSPDRSESPEEVIPSDHEKLPEEEIGLKLYNASGMQKEWGDVVVENKNTVIEKLIDDIPAEEVIDEEIAEDLDPKANIPKRKKPTRPSPNVKKAAKNKRAVRSVEQTNKTDKTVKKKEVKHEETEKEKSKDAEIAATASMLVERILQEEENEQEVGIAKNKPETPIDNNRPKTQSPVEEITEEILDEEVPVEKEPDEVQEETYDEETNEDIPQSAQSPQPSVASTQEDINSEDEIQSEDEEKDEDDDDNDNEKEESDEEISDNDDDNEKRDEEEESGEEKDDTDPQSDGSEAEEPASKENKTNKKVEEQRADPIAANKKEIQQNHAKGTRKGKRIDNKA